ncbi:hypothetical protein EDC39_101405 [Geothermobacter ehrlichii]|uniref:Uncharacterized protein n=1 Tax=Geothermobacter ehrlichii TaxID=213224 RepID=A0A5D3WPH3_9BACT|nr:hypothetical protein [Geothermobacter ehrlichii]TYP00244.1 hypothetical protein EDC39_101405 [Geothermobacter ehrlichii]
MNRCLLMGLFAIFLSVTTLWRVLREREEAPLCRLRRLWGRSCGTGLYFLVNVALPLVIGVVFLARGVVAFAPDGGDLEQLWRLANLRSFLPVPLVRLRLPLEPLFDFDLMVP